jgi:hypothetical protein
VKTPLIIDTETAFRWPVMLTLISVTVFALTGIGIAKGADSKAAEAIISSADNAKKIEAHEKELAAQRTLQAINEEQHKQILKSLDRMESALGTRPRDRDRP